MDLDLARQHDLLELAGADPLHCPRHRLLVVRRRHRAEDLVVPRRRRVEQRQRRRAELGEPPRDPRLEISHDVVRRDLDVHGQSHAVAAACQRELGHHQRRRCEPLPPRRAAAVGCEREAAKRDQTRAGRPVRSVREGGCGHRRPAPRHRPEPVGAACLELPHRPERGHRAPVAVGLLEAEPRFAPAPRGDRNRGRVDPAVNPAGDADQLGRPRGASAPESRVEPSLKPSCAVGVEPARRRREPSRADGHAGRLPVRR